MSSPIRADSDSAGFWNSPEPSADLEDLDRSAHGGWGRCSTLLLQVLELLKEGAASGEEASVVAACVQAVAAGMEADAGAYELTWDDFARAFRPERWCFDPRLGMALGATMLSSLDLATEASRMGRPGGGGASSVAPRCARRS